MQLFGGNVLSQLLFALTLQCALLAYGESLPIMELVVINTFASLIGGVAPVPGGMGVIEAGLIAGFTAAGVPETSADRRDLHGPSVHRRTCRRSGVGSRCNGSATTTTSSRSGGLGNAISWIDATISISRRRQPARSARSDAEVPADTDQEQHRRQIDRGAHVVVGRLADSSSPWSKCSSAVASSSSGRLELGLHVLGHVGGTRGCVGVRLGVGRQPRVERNLELGSESPFRNGHVFGVVGDNTR